MPFSRNPNVTARLSCEPLEDRLTPAVDLNQLLPAQFFDGFNGSPAVAAGDVTGDGTGDIIAVAPVNGHVKVIDGRTGEQRSSFFAYQGFTGSVRVVSADVNLDGYSDIITAAGRDGHIKVFSGTTGELLRSFLTHPGYNGPVFVDVARPVPVYPPFSGYSVSEPGLLVVRSAENGHVKTFDIRTGAQTGSYVAYPGYSGPMQVAVGDLNYDGIPDVVTASANGHVRMFDGRTQTERVSFMAYPGYTGTVEVTINNTSLGGGTGVTTRASNGHVKSFAPFTGEELTSFIDLNRDGIPDEARIALSPETISARV